MNRMAQNKIRVVLCALIFTVAMGLNVRAQDVRYNFDRSVDFSKYKTYKWVPAKGGARVDDLTDKQPQDGDARP